jgi:hypothetical protein
MPFIVNAKRVTDVSKNGAKEPDAYSELVKLIVGIVAERLSGPLRISDSKVEIPVYADAMTFYLPTSVNIPAILELIAKLYTKISGEFERREVNPRYFPNVLVRKSVREELKITVCNIGESTAPATGDIVFAASHGANVPRLKADTGEMSRNRVIVYLAKVSDYPNDVTGMGTEWLARILFGYIIDDSEYTTYESVRRSPENPYGMRLIENFNYPRDIRIVDLWKDSQCIIPVHFGRPIIPRTLAYPTAGEISALQQVHISPIPFPVSTLDPNKLFLRALYPPDQVGQPLGGDTGIRDGTWEEILPYLYDPQGYAAERCCRCGEGLYGTVYAGAIRRGVIPQNYIYVHCTRCAHDASASVAFFTSRYEIVLKVQHPRTYRDELMTREDLNPASRKMLLDMLEGRVRALFSKQFEMDRFSNEHGARYVVTLVDFGNGIIGTTDIDKVMTSAVKDDPMVATASQLVKIVLIGQHYSMII